MTKIMVQLKPIPGIVSHIDCALAFFQKGAPPHPWTNTIYRDVDSPLLSFSARFLSSDSSMRSFLLDLPNMLECC